MSEKIFSVVRKGFSCIDFRKIATVTFAFWFILPARADQIPVNAAPALTNWQAALSRFKKAGAFIGEDKYPMAQAKLAAATTNLPLPYNTKSSQFLGQG